MKGSGFGPGGRGRPARRAKYHTEAIAIPAKPKVFKVSMIFTLITGTGNI
jgi:hypothetical protein